MSKRVNYNAVIICSAGDLTLGHTLQSEHLKSKRTLVKRFERLDDKGEVFA